VAFVAAADISNGWRKTLSWSQCVGCGVQIFRGDSICVKLMRG
jgi:hypothetical protein